MIKMTNYSSPTSKDNRIELIANQIRKYGDQAEIWKSNFYGLREIFVLIKLLLFSYRRGFTTEEMYLAMMKVKDEGE